MVVVKNKSYKELKTNVTDVSGVVFGAALTSWLVVRDINSRES